MWRPNHDARTSLDQYECTIPAVEVSRSVPGTETKRLMRKPYKMTLKTERSGSRFVAARTADGNPSIRLELFHDSVPSLKHLIVGFEVLSGTTPAQLKALLDVMNERIVGTTVTPKRGARAKPCSRLFGPVHQTGDAFSMTFVITIVGNGPFLPENPLLFNRDHSTPSWPLV